MAQLEYLELSCNYGKLLNKGPRLGTHAPVIMKLATASETPPKGGQLHIREEYSLS